MGCYRNKQKQLPATKRLKKSTTTTTTTTTETGRPKSRRSRQCFCKRLQEKERLFEKSKQKEQAKVIEKITKSVDFKIKSCFGFIADPTKTRCHNLAILLCSLPLSLLLSRPKTMACHNLYNERLPPPKLQSLLGLGLNFCL
jgi:hypothetical protein